MKTDHIIVAMALSASIAGASIIPFLAGSPQPTGDPPAVSGGFVSDTDQFTADADVFTADIEAIPATADLDGPSADTDKITSDKS
jgi:hypothetical protein